MPDYEFGEPWNFGEWMPGFAGSLRTNDNDPVGFPQTHSAAVVFEPPRGQRIKAAINFCAGIPTEALEKLGLDGLRKMAVRVADGGPDHHWCGCCTVGDQEHDEDCPVGLLLPVKGEPA